MYSIVILLSKYVFCPQIWKIISFVRNCSERQKRVQHVIHSVVCSKRKTTVTSQLLVQKLQCNLHITCMQFTEHKPGSEAMLYSKENGHGNIYVTACLSADSNCFRAIFHLALCWLDSLGPHSVWAPIRANNHRGKYISTHNYINPVVLKQALPRQGLPQPQKEINRCSFLVIVFM